MLHPIRNILLFTLVAFSVSVVQATPLVEEIIDQLSQDDYQDYLEDLEGFGTRYYTTAENTAAGEYLYDAFDGFGLSVREHSFSYLGHDLVNIEATLPGLVRPNEVFILGAHFDSIASRTAGNPSETTAPGADDNASGSAGILEIASVLSLYQFESTIRFVGFNAEEDGLIGSGFYAADALAAGDDILGMINLDMIAYTAGDLNEDVDVLGDSWLRDLFVANVDAFTSLSARTWDHNDDSDHYHFKSDLYPGSASIVASEEPGWAISGGSNPYYHRITDTSDHLDYDFAMEITRASTATLAEIAGLIPVQLASPAAWGLLLLGLALLGMTRGDRSEFGDT